MKYRNMWQYTIYIILIITTLNKYIDAQEYYIDKSTSIDLSRAKYLDLELNLWNTIENVDQLNALKQIFQNHREYSQQYLSKKDIVPEGDEFIVLQRFYEYQLLQDDLQTIDNLYQVYEQLLEKYTNRFDELAILDFADVILFDERFPINKTLEQIENIMVKQALYYKVMLVG